MEKTSSIKRPWGITILAIFFILGAVSILASNILETTPFVMFLGKMYTGKKAYIISGIEGLIGLFLGMGLLKLKKYAWWVLMISNSYSFFSIIINHFIAQSNDQKYRIFFEIVFLSFIVLTTGYIFKKRSYFK